MRNPAPFYSLQKPWSPTAEIDQMFYKKKAVSAPRKFDGEADAHFGFLSTLAALDIPRSSPVTQELLGWRPVQPALIPDLKQSPAQQGTTA
ncbi:hypothetical protein YSY43_30020 [Paenibacillus sp. YSY-4.3]